MYFLGVTMHIDIYKGVYPIEEGIDKLYELLDKELSQDWKSYTITINDVTHEINSQCDPAIRDRVIKQLLKDAINAHIDYLDTDMDTAFNVIERIFSGERKEDHQFEIVKEEIVSNLDADGKPITAKSLDHESVYVQWQDENKFKFEEENV